MYVRVGVGEPERSEYRLWRMRIYVDAAEAGASLSTLRSGDHGEHPRTRRSLEGCPRHESNLRTRSRKPLPSVRSHSARLVHVAHARWSAGSDVAVIGRGDPPRAVNGRCPRSTDCGFCDLSA